MSASNNMPPPPPPALVTASATAGGSSASSSSSAASTSFFRAVSASAGRAAGKIANAFGVVSAGSKTKNKNKTSSSSEVPRPRSIKKWFRKQRKKHMASMSKEQKERMVRNMRRQNREQTKHRMCRKAKKMAFASSYSRSNMAKTLSTFDRSRALTRAAAEEERMTSRSLMASVQTAQQSRLDSSESEDDVDALEAMAAVAQSEVSDEKAVSLLEQLRKEPKNDEETASKFGVYEQYLAIVEKSREECAKFHKLCRTELKDHPGVVQRMSKAMKSIDSDSNRSINWDNLGGRWFVYDMTRQSDRNNTFIGKVFTGLKRDLEMIQDNDMDCPICLENLTTVPSGVRVLHCCHKLCGECYDHWKAACRGGRVICPLCRQQDFQAAVVTRVPTMVQNYLHTMHSDSEESDSGDEEEPGVDARASAAVSASASASASSSSSSSASSSSTSSSSSTTS